MPLRAAGVEWKLRRSRRPCDEADEMARACFDWNWRAAGVVETEARRQTRRDGIVEVMARGVRESMMNDINECFWKKKIKSTEES